MFCGAVESRSPRPRKNQRARFANSITVCTRCRNFLPRLFRCAMAWQSLSSSSAREHGSRLRRRRFKAVRQGFLASMLDHGPVMLAEEDAQLHRLKHARAQQVEEHCPRDGREAEDPQKA